MKVGSRERGGEPKVPCAFAVAGLVINGHQPQANRRFNSGFPSHLNCINSPDGNEHADTKQEHVHSPNLLVPSAGICRLLKGAHRRIKESVFPDPPTRDRWEALQQNSERAALNAANAEAPPAPD